MEIARLSWVSEFDKNVLAVGIRELDLSPDAEEDCLLLKHLVVFGKLERIVCA